MMCTAHAGLRDRLKRFATIVDVATLIASVFLVAHTFVDISRLSKLAFLNIDYGIWLGILSATVFALTLVQMRVNWKAKAEGHARSFAIYSEVKRDVSRLLTQDALNEEVLAKVFSRYDLAGDIGNGIPESEFLKQKQRDRVKVFISDYLDRHPGASISLIRLKLFLQDTFGWNLLDSLPVTDDPD